MTLLIGHEVEGSYRLYADTMIESSGEAYYTRKIQTLFNGDCHFAVAGAMGPSLVFSLSNKKKPKEYTAAWVHRNISVTLHKQYRIFNTSNEAHDYAGLFVCPDGMFYFDSCGLTTQVHDRFYCVGSGSSYARGFLDGNGISNYEPAGRSWLTDLYVGCHYAVASVGSEFTEKRIMKRST